VIARQFCKGGKSRAQLTFEAALLVQEKGALQQTAALILIEGCEAHGP